MNMDYMPSINFPLALFMSLRFYTNSFIVMLHGMGMRVVHIPNIN
jgi:ABC-type arginine/histidine transport system permease subunit